MGNEAHARVELLEQIIKDFNKDALIRFYKLASDKFRPVSEDYSQYLPESDKRFENIEQIGRIEHEKKAQSIAFFISSVSGEISERDSKKKQYDIGKKILRDNYLDAGIFVFYGKNNFRLSLIAASYSGPKRKFTTFKRYTYFVSPELTNKTFKDQLKKCDFSSVEKILESFSIEAVSNEFYNNFKPIFDEIINAIQGKNDIDIQTKKSFALLFAMRVIFLGFVQKKRWIGDNQKFIQDFWDEYNKHKKENNCSDEFYIRWLEPLFFKALNSQPGTPVEWGNNDFSKETEKILKMAPFLNGELFKRKQGVDDIGLFLPDEIIGKYFVFLFQYNFTIDESTAYDEELELNPEFLGIIFEKFVNKDHGSVYTPRTEVDLMCRLALIRWLIRKNEFDTKELYHLFFREGGAGLEFEEDQKYGSFSTKEIRKLLNLLESVTVCDPAAGSGAFEVGMLHVINDLVETLYTKMPDFPEDIIQKEPYERKKDIIAKSLYGVEVQGYAVWINQLRLWLTLFIDMPDEMKLSLTPLLPSLNFKIRRGDSLVQRIGNKMFPVHGHAAISKGIKDKITKLKKEKIDFYYNRGKDEGYIRQLENKIFREIIQTEIQVKERELLLIAKPQEQLGLGFHTEKQKQMHILETEKYEQKRKVAQAEIEELKEELKNLQDEHPLIWCIEFSEIFYDKGGFDIIIGNPPYVRQEQIADPEAKEEPKEYKKLLQQTAALDYSKHFKNRKIDGKSDLYTFFYVRTLHLLNKEGVHCFICSNSWLDVGYGVWLQEFLLENVPVNLIIDNHARRSFASSDVNTVITLFDAPVKNYNKTEHLIKFVAFKKPFEECIFTEMLWDIHQANKIIKNDVFRVYTITAEKLYDEGSEFESKEHKKAGGGKYIGDKWGGKYLRAPDIFFTILEKGKDKLVKLKDIAKVRRGKTTGINDFFYVDNNKVKEFKIEEKFLLPVVKSPKNFKNTILGENEISNYVFVCNVSKSQLKRENATGALGYIMWGEKQITKDTQKTKNGVPWPQVPSVRSRNLWYSIRLPTEVDVFCNRFFNERFFFGFADFPITDDQTFYGGIFKKCGDLDKFDRIALLNTTPQFLFVELLGRVNLGEGVLQYAVYEMKSILTFDIETKLNPKQQNCFKKMANRIVSNIFVECGIDPKSETPIEEQEPKPLPDRKELDDIVFDAIGLTEQERKDVYRAVCKLVWNRLSKARSV